MTNLFSIFDPSTPNFMSSNWLSMTLVLSCTPLAIWMNPSRPTYLFKALLAYLFSEFSPLIKKAPFLLISILSFFSLIMYNNVLGLLPYIFTASSHLVFTLTLALPAWLALMSYGWLNNTSNLLVHLIPQGTPVILMPFMVLIETVSTLIRPGTLAIRLSANMIAGHLLITLLSSAFSSMPTMALPILFTAQIALSLLEIAVAFIQAYVFSVLLTLYSAECID
uniref:ATP synthase subunit a n=1 Tax=Eurythenes maldoror TaxID=1836943 RepID=A0A343RBC1_9CRUS|nr:ATP synthase F0 subunit 6 [Eurythenes maldoror]ATX68764.1 ATP synthase F0 subunit 6 [Eurythenes maldoror]